MVKARSDNKHRRSTAIVILICSVAACAGIFLAVVNFIKGSIPFGIIYSVAALLLIAYIIIRINTVYSTYITTDTENIIMKTWSNGFLPYNTKGRNKLISSFVPTSLKVIEIPIEKVKCIYIGTPTFIRRYAEKDEEFEKAVVAFERSDDGYEKRQVRSMDIFYVKTSEGNSSYMSVEDFGAEGIKRILRVVTRKNPDTVIRVNNRKYRVPQKSDINGKAEAAGADEAAEDKGNIDRG